MDDQEHAFILDIKGNIIKREKDLSKEANDVIEKTERLLANNDFEAAIEHLIQFEREARNVADLVSYVRVMLHLIDCHVKYNQWDRLEESVVFLSKRRGQFKQTIVELVRKCCSLMEFIPEGSFQTRFIKTLCQISDNKIYVENERARLLMILSKEAENRNDLEEAARLVHNLQIDCYNTMHIDEKNDLMLEQVRLCLANSDLVRAQIISKRVIPSTIDDEKNLKLKKKYYNIMMHLKFREKAYQEVAQLGLSSLALSTEDSVSSLKLLRAVIICLFVCNIDQTRNDLSHRVTQHRNFMDMYHLKTLLNMFLVYEIIDWQSVDTEFGQHIRDVIAPENFEFVKSQQESDHMYDKLRTFVNYHNLIVIQRCYNRMSLPRLASILKLSEQDAEVVLANAVYFKVIFARINRPQKLINFSPDLNSKNALRQYLSRVDGLLLQLTNAVTLINKEYNYFVQSSGK